MKRLFSIIIATAFFVNISAQQLTTRQRHLITNLNIALATTVTGLVLVTTPPVYGAEQNNPLQQEYSKIHNDQSSHLTAEQQTNKIAAFRIAALEQRLKVQERVVAIQERNGNCCTLLCFIFMAGLMCPRQR